MFRKVGLSLPIDGSADHEFDIKGFAEIEVGDWHIDLATMKNSDQYADIEEENDYNQAVEFVADGE